MGSTRRAGAALRGQSGQGMGFWEYGNGPIPDGILVLHKCDNRPCVNYVEHLYLGNNSDNMRDAIRAGTLMIPIRKNGKFTGKMPLLLLDNEGLAILWT